MLADWQDAVYSTDDGQVYTDLGVTGSQVQAEITREMTAASLDQEFQWSADQPNRTLDDQALTLAEVQRQASAVLAQSPFAAELAPLTPGIVAFVPPVVGYRALASATYAEFENPVTGAVNALSGIGTAGPGPLPSQVPVAAAAPTLVDTDTLVGSPRPLDRSFWFLVFAGFLDSRTAYQASESVMENSLTVVERAETQWCTRRSRVATSSRPRRSAPLSKPGRSRRPSSSDSVSVLADGSLQLVTCDPGVGYETVDPLGVARELVGWRTAELATLEAVRASNGTEAEAAAAWAVVEASTVGVDLGARRVTRHRPSLRRTEPPLPRCSPLLLRLPPKADQSRKFWNCSGMPMSSAFSIAMTSWSHHVLRRHTDRLALGLARDALGPSP